MDTPQTPITPINNLFNLFSAEHENALKQGIYNGIGLFILSIVCVASYALYIILLPFVKPLIWALLCGSVLFPVKLYITNTVQSWFKDMDDYHEPLLVNLTIVPLRIIDNLSECLGKFVHQKIKYVGMFFSIIGVMILFYWYTPGFFITIVWNLFQFGIEFIVFIINNCNIYLIFTITVGYVIVLLIYWKPNNSSTFNKISLIIWSIFSLYLSNVFGIYQVAVFLTLQVFFIIGFVYEVILIMENEEINIVEAVQLIIFGSVTSDDCKNSSSDDDKDKQDIEDEKIDKFIDESSVPTSTPNDNITQLNKNKLSSIRRSMSMDYGRQPSSLKTKRLNKKSYIQNPRIIIRDRNILRKIRNELSLDLNDDNVDTGKYMYGAMWACTGMLLWKQKWILAFLIIPIVWYIIKQTSRSFGLSKIIKNQLKPMIEYVKKWYDQRQDAILPIHIRGIYKLYIIIDKKLRDVLKGSVDAVATIIVIFGLIIFLFCSSIFIIIQIYGEGMHLIQVTGEILNSTLVNNPDIDWLPQQWEESVNSLLDNAYTYGRTAISDGIKGLVKDMEHTKAEIIEKKVIELWDRLYQAWMQSTEPDDLIGPTVDVSAAATVWQSLIENYNKIPGVFNMSSLQNFAKDNIGILLSVLDSVLRIIKGNMSIVMSIFSELMYVVLISGSVLLNFTLSTVVFFTTLFYLLSSSNKIYKPIELVGVFSPISCNSFANALQQSVNGVFAATFKLASFFGMWTWFIHNLFEVKIVYLPSAFASVLAAVPFLDAYFACIPATIELWFTRGPMIAVLFFIFHFLPCNIVITDFYKEIKSGGHPYLTGLSIAGGIFCLGVEGAIFGPLLLCCIMVVINLSRKYMQSVNVDNYDALASTFNQPSFTN
ncbi:hypothetical protein HCN44_010756 [Aphidius gifuensis]|uniref:Transmembrane protein 245 n=1 Tax=Aphidius gifuensis TaxID=684658 RepID=A0A835CT53_APHGI|nr:transmembrane protein 245 isoform X2 [Aphidius gifuensis]KAF7991955.1 hypothetical protein HCN44_010756 [Aphidius gifuensis]